MLEAGAKVGIFGWIDRYLTKDYRLLAFRGDANESALPSNL